MNILILFAQLPDPKSPESIGWILITIAALAVAANQGYSLIDHLRDKKKAHPMTLDNQPLLVQAAQEFASKKDHEALVARQAKHEEDTNHRFAAQSAASSAGREKIYNLIREQEEKRREESSRNNASIHKRINQIVETVGRIDGKISRLK